MLKKTEENLKMLSNNSPHRYAVQRNLHSQPPANVKTKTRQSKSEAKYQKQSQKRRQRKILWFARKQLFQHN